MMRWLEALLWTLCDALSWAGMLAGTLGALTAIGWIGATWIERILNDDKPKEV